MPCVYEQIMSWETGNGCHKLRGVYDVINNKQTRIHLNSYFQKKNPKKNNTVCALKLE